MRRLFASLMVAGALATTSSTLWARSPAPSPGSTGQPTATVWAFPDQGFAIAFPDGWDVTQFDVTEFGALALPWALTASGPGGYCEVVDWSLAEPALPVESLDGWLAALTSRWDHDLAVTDVAGAVIDLPAGRVGRVTMDVVPFPCSSGEPGACPDWASQEASGRYAMYLFGDGHQWILLGCSGGAPEDDWLSIAETFEFLPRGEDGRLLHLTHQARSQGSDLAALFPATLDGRPVEVEVFSGSEWLSRYDAATPEGAVARERAEALLAAAGRSVEDLSVATALHVPSPGNVATITAIQLRGTEAHEVVEPLIGLVRGDIASPRLRLRPMAERSVLEVRDAASPGTYPVTVYPVGDTVWFVDAGGPLREQILEALPQAPPRSAAFDLAAVFPKRIGGARRDSLGLGSGWGMPLATRVPLDLEGLAEEVYLATGAGHYDVVTASGMSQEVGFRALLTAYQIAGADEVVMQQVLEEILVPRFNGGAARAEPVEVAGRDLVLVQVLGRRGGEPTEVYLYVSGDTIWVLEAEGPDLTELLGQLP